MRKYLPYIIIVLIGLLFSRVCAARIIYVKYNATGSDNGTSWVNAYNDLDTAIPSMTAGDSIWVAAGTYSPDPLTATSGFTINTGVVIGHFAGNETKVSDRDLQNAAYETILDGQGISEHIIKSQYSFQIDGFTITRAAANGPSSYLRSQGGGIFIQENLGYAGNIVISNCLFKNNNATDFGSAISDYPNGLSVNITLNKCTFENNNVTALNIYEANVIIDSCEFTGHIQPPLNFYQSSSLQMAHCVFNNNGGAVCMSNMSSSTQIEDCQFISNIDNTSVNGTINAYGSSSSLEVSNCVFQGNTAAYGGAVIVDKPSTFTNCLFSDNTAGSYGGAVYATDNIGCTFINCAFENNNSYFSGGAVSANAGDLLFTNCTFYNNNSISGIGGAVYGSNATLDITNSIFWENKASTNDSSQLQITGNGPIRINHSLIQGGCPLNAICSPPVITSDPLFINPAQNNFTLSACSPAINTGLNDSVPQGLTVDLAGNPRILDQVVDMGAYESHGVIIDSFTINVMPAINSFSSTDFSLHYSDPSGALQKIKIISLPDEGILKFNGAPVSADTIINAANIPQLSFVADSCTNSASFLWSGMSAANDCSLSKSAIVNLSMMNSTIYSRPAAPVITALGATTLCTGDSVILQASAGYENYLWNNNDSGNSIQVKDSGVYTVEGENHHCHSSSSDTIVITLKPIPVLSVSGNGSRCLAGATSVTVTGGDTYSWYADSTSASPIASGSTYTYTNLEQTDTLYANTEKNGCYSRRYPVITYIDTIPTSPIVDDTTFCHGSSVNLNLTIRNYDSDYLYTWYVFNGSTATQIGGAEASPLKSIAPTVIQNDSIILVQATGIACISKQDTIKLKVFPIPPQPVISYQGTLTTCFPDSIQLFGPAGYNQYAWIEFQADTSIGEISNLNQLYINKSAEVFLLVRNSAGCTSISSLPVFDTINTVTLSSIIVDGDSLRAAPGFTFYQWYINNSSINGATFPIYIPATNGNYTVHVTDQNGCEATSAAVVINMSPTPSVTPADTIIDSSVNIIVYPNPTSGTIYLRSQAQQTVHVQVISELGKVVKEGDYIVNENAVPINISSFAGGIYFLKITGDRVVQIAKIAKD